MPSDDLVLDDALSRQTSKKKMMKHVFISSAIGFASAVIVSSILYLVATNRTYSLLFAGGMLFSGASLGWRAQMQCSSAEAKTALLRLAMAGAVITALGGIAAILLAFMEGKSSVAFLILYSCCSIGALYALAFIATDIFNRSVRENGAELNAKQLYSIAGIAILVGSGCGFFFNAVNVEQHVSRFGFEQWVSAAIGALGGALIGYVNFTFAHDGDFDVAFDPLPMEDFTPTHDNADT
jgi:hypothetical protein